MILKKGNSDIAFFIGFFALLFVLWFLGGGANKEDDTKQSSLFGLKQSTARPAVVGKSGDADSEPVAGGYTKAGEAVSPYYGQIKISSRGTASSASVSGYEYITLQATSKLKEPVRLTGWVLTNGKNRKLVSNYSSTPEWGVSDRVRIPEGQLIYAPELNSVLQPIVLAPGEKAIINSGQPRTFEGRQVTASFKTNICGGYLQKLDPDVFKPSLTIQCPKPEDEPGVESLDPECVDFIEGMSRCHTPEFDDYKNVAGQSPERGKFVDGKEGLSNQCRQFLAEHYNYDSCLVYHLGDENFFGKEWRVYLNRTWELWAKNHEVITLYDDLGRLVAQLTYK